jgi:hypothetical protein
MNQASKSISILSLGQIMAIAREHITDGSAFNILEEHVHQVAAIILEKPLNKVDEQSKIAVAEVESMLSRLEAV